MQLRTRVWGAGKILMLLGALTATYFLFAAASMRAALRARQVEVPDLTRQTAAGATALAANLGLSLRVDETPRPDANVAAGLVLGQDPEAGTTLRRQRSVRVWLSAGPRASQVPTVLGETERGAEVRLVRDGFGLAGLSEIRSQDYPPDIVVAQDPPPDSKAAPNVALLVNRAEFGASVVMPDLIGVDGDRAAAMLRNHGFRASIVGSTPYPGIPPGVVLRQSPQSGFQIAPGEPISIEVSQ